jgi:hypothetical protein
MSSGRWCAACSMQRSDRRRPDSRQNARILTR